MTVAAFDLDQPDLAGILPDRALAAAFEAGWIDGPPPATGPGQALRHRPA